MRCTLSRSGYGFVRITSFSRAGATAPARVYLLLMKVCSLQEIEARVPDVNALKLQKKIETQGNT